MTGKLLKLKSWVTLKDAASHLSLVLEEKVNEGDLIQLALERELTLSVVFPESTHIVLYESVDVSREGLPMPEFENYEAPVDSISILMNDRRQIWRHYTFHTYDCCVYEPNLDRCYTTRGIHDLLINPTSERILSQLLQASLSKPLLLPPRWPSKPIMLTDSEFGELWGLVSFTAECEGEAPAWIDRFEPITTLPESASLVVSRDTLAQFTASLLGNKANTDQDTPPNNDHQDYPPHLEALILAWRKRWKNADRHDRSTHPKKDTVKSWLIEQGLSDRTADAGATIITPDWKK